MSHALSNESHYEDSNSKVIFGFWIFILTDFILFAALFATYSVLHNNTYGGVGIKDIVDLPYSLVQSLIFVTSSLSYGLGIVAMKKNEQKSLLFWLGVTFILGLAFVSLEFNEFAKLVHAGHTWQSSAFLSSFFTLVGLQGIHVTIGLLWIVIVMIQLTMQHINPTMRTRLACLGLFWDFLNIIWIFIFSIVYLMGAI
ncbi:MAG: cytochrome c oxidase subunit 3 [Gammaproteobacteria bacterium]